MTTGLQTLAVKSGMVDTVALGRAIVFPIDIEHQCWVLSSMFTIFNHIWYKSPALRDECVASWDRYETA